MSNLFPVSDEQLFEGFDKVAEKWGIKPPNSPGEQRAVALILGAWIAGARFYQHIQEHHESKSSDFMIPGIDFSPAEANAILADAAKLFRQR